MAALEWSLIDPIIINSEDDIKATNWRDRGLRPFTHQIQNLTAQEATGDGLDVEFQRNTPVVVTTYQSVSSRLESLTPGQFDLCILDEAHKLRNLHGGQKPPEMAKNIRAALMRRLFRYVVMLTATPVQNKVWDLYSLIDLLKVAEGKPNPLGSPHGSDFENVVILNLVGAGTVEDRIVARLLEKLQGVSQALGDIEGILEAADLDEDSSASFESRMRKMVVEALQGKDVAVAQRLLEADIDRAETIFEEQREYLNRTLGQTRDDPAFHRPPPKIARNPPRMAYRDFDYGAKRAEGCTVREIDALRAEATAPGRVLERISFSDGNTADSSRAIFAESLARCYLPGKPAFERLVQHWIDHHAHSIADTTPGSLSSAVELAKAWCRSNPGCEYIAAKYTSKEPAFQGTVHIEVTAGTGVDKFEKLIRATIVPPARHGPVTAAKTTEAISSDVAIGKILPPFNSTVKAVVEADAEVKVFCEYYLGRLREGRAEPGRDQYHLSKMESDFRPYVQADVVAIQGVSYDTGTVQVRFEADGVEYQSDLVAIPATGQWLDGLDELATSSISGIRVDRDLLVCSKKSGRLALPSEVVTCEESGAVLLPDETGNCTLSQKRVDRDLLSPSSISGVLAIRTLLVPCDVTGKRVLPSELETCAVTGTKAIPSQLGTCAATGQRVLNTELGFCAKSRKSILKPLLGTSDFSGIIVAKTFLIRSEKPPFRAGLLDETGRCEHTGQLLLKDELGQSYVSGKFVDIALLVESEWSRYRALPEEMETCQLTGKRVLPSELETCAITSRRAVRSEMVKSIFSNRLGIREHAARLRSGAWALMDEVTKCVWLDEPILKSEAARCRITREIVSKSQLNGEGQLIALAELLDGTARTVRAEPTLIPRLRELDSDFAGLQSVITVQSPGDIRAVCCEVVTRSWLRKKVQYYGLLIRVTPKGIEIVGRGVRGYRDENSEFVIEADDLVFG